MRVPLLGSILWLVPDSGICCRPPEHGDDSARGGDARRHPRHRLHRRFAPGADAQPDGGQAVAFYAVIANLIGLGLGPTAVALLTDYVFGDGEAAVLAVDRRLRLSCHHHLGAVAVTQAVSRERGRDRAGGGGSMRMLRAVALAAIFFLTARRAPDYLDYSGRDDVLSGGVKMIPVKTPKGRSASGPSASATTRRSRCCCCTAGRAPRTSTSRPSTATSPRAGIEYYYYDQLGSYYSDQPDEPELWEMPRFVEEVEQVRQALGLDRDNFYLLGQSWGGILAIEYALAVPGAPQGPDHLQHDGQHPGVQRVRPEGADAGDGSRRCWRRSSGFEAAGDYENPRYMELLIEHHYVAAHPAHARRRVAGPGEPRVQAPQQGDLHPDAGAERAGGERQARSTGIASRTSARSRCRRW